MKARLPSGRVGRSLVVGTAGVVLAIAILMAAWFVFFALFEYRSNKVTAQSEHAERVWDRIHAGMTDDAVRRLAGAPSKKHGSCWTWGEGWVFDAQTVFRVCFDHGRVIRKTSSDAFD